MTRIPFGTIVLAAGLVAAAAPAVRAQLACGDTIGKGQTVTLTADLGPCDGVESAIVIDSGVLDLGGHTLSCADTNENQKFSYGLDIRGKNAVVRNGTVTGCIDNVYVPARSTRHHRHRGAALRFTSPHVSKNRLSGNAATGNTDDGFQARGRAHDRWQQRSGTARTASTSPDDQGQDHEQHVHEQQRRRHRGDRDQEQDHRQHDRNAETASRSATGRTR